jgi:hypothetical protein
MVFDHGSGEGGRALWMENVLSAGGGGGGAVQSQPYGGGGPTSLRSLPPYPNPPPAASAAARYYPTYNTPWLVRVSHVAIGTGRYERNLWCENICFGSESGFYVFRFALNGTLLRKQLIKAKVIRASIAEINTPYMRPKICRFM